MRALGLADEHAADAAEVLVATDLRGIESHGVNMLRGYLQQFHDGVLNPKAGLAHRPGSACHRHHRR